MDHGSEEKSAPPEEMTVGEAAKILGLSNTTVQRACVMWEEDMAKNVQYPRGISFRWTSPDSGRRDSNGKLLRGKRRLWRDSVIHYGKKIGALKV